MDNKANQNNQGNQNKQGNQNGSGDNNLFYGIIFVVAGILFRIWMKEDSFTFWGLFTVECRTLGIPLLVIGGWLLLTSNGFGNLVGEILALPFRLLGWALEHWYLVVLAVALFWYFGDRETEKEAPRQEQSSVSVEVPMWTVEAPAETVPVWIPETTVPVATAPPVTDPVKEYPNDHRDVGLCKELTRNAEALLVFVNDSASNWTQQEIQNFMGNMVNPGLDFIERNASAWGYNITFESCYYEDGTGNVGILQYPGTVTDWDSETQVNDLVPLAAQNHGFATAEDMIKNVQDYAGTDQVAIVFVLDKDGRSYARWNTSNDSFVEHAVIYTSWDGKQERPYVIAHEVMHLFGAEDLYEDRGERVNRAAYVKRHYPRELFYLGQWNVNDNIICDFTAYTVGWLNYLPAEFNTQEWWS